MLTKTAVLLCAAFAIVSPTVTSAAQIYVNNMSDAAILMTAYDPKTPTKTLATWCVETGAYEMHELKDTPGKLEADVMKNDECKEPKILNKTLLLPTDTAAVYKLSGVAGKYSLTGPFKRVVQK